MKLYGLIGFPLTHSFSGDYFTDKFKKENISDSDYKLFPLPEISELNNLINQNRNLIGFNVTIPYKEAVIPFLSMIDPVAKQVGAVNTVKVLHSKNRIRLHGYNSDIFGFQKTISPLLSPSDKNALILGSGGAAKSVAFVLDKMGVNYCFVSRRPNEENQIAYSDVSGTLIESSTILINCTPQGMSPYNNEYPDIPYQYISEKHILYDLIYNPSETNFLKFGRQQKARIKNGLSMLSVQAEKSWWFWNNM